MRGLGPRPSFRGTGNARYLWCERMAGLTIPWAGITSSQSVTRAGAAQQGKPLPPAPIHIPLPLTSNDYVAPDYKVLTLYPQKDLIKDGQQVCTGIRLGASPRDIC